MTNSSILFHHQMVCDRSELACAKDPSLSRHFGVSLIFLSYPSRPRTTSYPPSIFSDHDRAEDILGSYDSIMHLKSSRQKHTRSSLKTYTGIPLYTNPHYPDLGAWMILISVQISLPHIPTLRNHSLNFRNQINSDHILVP